MQDSPWGERYIGAQKVMGRSRREEGREQDNEHVNSAKKTKEPRDGWIHGCVNDVVKMTKEVRTAEKDLGDVLPAHR